MIGFWMIGSWLEAARAWGLARMEEWAVLAAFAGCMFLSAAVLRARPLPLRCWPQGASRALVLAALVAWGILAQCLLELGRFGAALGLYAAVGGAAALLALRGSPGRPAPLRLAVELALLALVLLAALLGRFVALGDVPYGIEGDESLWTTKVAFHTLAGTPLFDSAYRLRYTPASYGWEWLSFRLLGTGFAAPRYAVAALSFVSVGLFYGLARLAFGPRVALVAAALQALGTVDLAMSRVALVESQVQFPLLLSYLLLLLGLQRGGLPWFGLAGLALVLGLLTFDTFVLAPLVAVGYAAWWFWRRAWPLRRWLPRMGLLVLPVVLATPHLARYLIWRSVDLNKSMTALGRAPALADDLARMAGNLGEVLFNFYHLRWTDFAARWHGPVINALLVPLLLLGAAWLLVCWLRTVAQTVAWHGTRGPESGCGESHALFPLWWGVVQLVPAAVYFGAPYVRVLYPAFPALFLIVAVFVVDLAALVRPRWLGGLALALLLTVVSVGNVTVYARENPQPAGDVARRDWIDSVGAAAAPSTAVLLPYVPGCDDFAWIERWAAAVSAGGQVGMAQAAHLCRAVAYPQLLAEVAASTDLDGVAVVVDREAQGERAARYRTLLALRACFPDLELVEGARFDVYHLDPSTGVCRGAAAPELRVAVESGTVGFAWRGPAQTGYKLACERRADGLLIVEGERLEGAGWTAVPPSQSPFDGLGYAMDSWQAGPASTSVALPAGAPYRVWLHAYRASSDDAVHRVHLPGGTAETRVLDAGRWQWYDLGVWHLPSGSFDVSIGKIGAQRQHTTLVDALLFAADHHFDPGQDRLWAPAYDSGRVESAAGEHRADRGDWAPGNYRCRVRVYDGERLVDAGGRSGLWSDYAGFDLSGFGGQTGGRTAGAGAGEYLEQDDGDGTTP